MRKVILMLLAVVIFSSNAIATVIDGKICFYLKTGFTGGFHCREPKDPDELQTERAKDNAQHRLNACNFSLFSTWPGEVEKIQKKLVVLRNSRKSEYQELYWAQQDINKQAYLPSETVRASYETAAIFRGLIAQDDAEINTQEWCLKCAIKRNNGAANCEE